MVLATNLVSTPLREKGATGGRYDFQTMWGLALLFQQHGTNDDYAIVFEFHDDVALLNSATNPTTVRFYQVKSKATNGGWTLTSLLKREKVKIEKGTTEKPSYIDKMFDNFDKFQSAVLSADFVSNQLCGFNAAKNSFRLNECSSEDFKKIVASVQQAYPKATEAQIGLLGFQRTDLSLGDVVSHTKGKLQTFIAGQLGTVWFSPEAVYVNRRANGTPYRRAKGTPLRDGARLIGHAPLRCARRREGGARPEARAAQRHLLIGGRRG